MPQDNRFIGRRDELKALHRAMDAWGTQQVVAVGGIGGIGKTRLLNEFRHEAEEKAKDIGRPVRIELISEIKDSEWFEQLRAGADEMAAALGVELKLPDFGKTNVPLQTTSVADYLAAAIDRNPDAIIINLGSQERLQEAIRAAHEKNIRLFTLDNFTPGIERYVTTHVHQDDIDGAYLSLDHLAKSINHEGKVGVIWMKEAAPLQRRHNALHPIREIYKQIEWIEDPIDLFDPEHATEIARQRVHALVTAHPQIKALWLPWDKLARGAVEALHALDRLDVQVHSFDLGPKIYDRMVAKGSPWVATVATNPAEAGRVMVRLAVQAVIDPISTQPRYVLLPMTLYTSSSLRQESNGDRFQWQHLALPEASRVAWTPQLQRLQEQVKAKKAQLETQMVISPIDFDDRQYTIFSNIGLHIADTLKGEGPEQVNNYRAKVAEYRRKRDLVSRPTLDKLVEEADELLYDLCRHVTNTKRIILTFDTAEKSVDLELWPRLAKLINAVPNMVSILAGRKMDSWLGRLRIELKIPAEYITAIDLQPLSPSDRQEYLTDRLQAIGIKIDKVTRGNILELSGGKPIIIDLAAHYCAEGVDLNWLSQEDSNLTEEKTRQFESLRS